MGCGVQLPGINLINALTILAAIGEIERFPDAKHLVAVWHVLTKETADRFAVPEKVASSCFKLAYALGTSSLQGG